MIIKNCMEDIVFYYLEKVLLNYTDVCKCEICKADIAALSLNNLPPKYIASSMGEVYTRTATLQQQFEADVFSTVVKAIKTISNNPRHNRTEYSEQ